MNIFDSFDNDDLELFDAVAGAVEGIRQEALQVLATEGLIEVQYEDAGNLLEQSIGVGFVTAQAFLVRVCGRWPGINKRNRRELYRQGPQIDGGAYVAEVINDAANYWKHAPDWVGDNTDGPLAIKTRKAINALLGEDLSATPLHDILFLIDSSGRVGSLSEHLRRWAKALHPIIEKKLWGKE